jgi:tricorn protease
VDEGLTLPVTRGSGARERWASFDPAGERLVYVSDASREEDLRVVDAWGREEPQVVRPAGSHGWHFPPRFSPDGEWIAYADSDHALYFLPSTGGAPRRIDRGEQEAIAEYVWSPDGRWLAYVKQAWTGYRSIYLFDRLAEQVHRFTGDQTDDFSPAWDPEGRYLHFLSNRTTNPLLGLRDMQNVNIEATRPYLLLLREDVENPFAARAGLPPGEGELDTDETAAGVDEGGDVGDGDADEDRIEPVEIELERLEQRVVAFPDVFPGQYHALDAAADRVFWLATPLIGMADWDSLWDEGSPRASLISFTLEDWIEETLLEGVSGYVLAPEAGMLAVMQERGLLYVIDAAQPPGEDLAEAAVDLSGVVVELDPRAEWEQIFHEGWRQMRDFYWDPGLGGVDWEGIRDQYAALLPRLATRDDLRDLMAEMIAELSTSHTYVFGGDPGQEAPRRSTGLLGADLRREGRFFRVERIYHGSPADDEPTPLQTPGARVGEGEYILAVNHQSFRDDRPFHAQLEGLAGKQVLLTVNARPRLEGARSVVVRPLESERGVRYADWVRRNRERVERETDGRIGYLHIPDMLQHGMIEFNTWFYPQLDKQGMIVDVRWNGGGFVSQMILERLRRPVLSFELARGGGTYTYPYRTLNGPFVVLVDEHAGSDGDIFPAAVQLEGLAPVIGQRSWGGVVGISGLRPLVDGGLLTQPQVAWWDPQRGWELENQGVEPDIEVVNLPQDVARGIDAQLDRAIQEVLRLHEEQPPLRPEFGPVRPRGREAYREEGARWSDER